MANASFLQDNFLGGQWSAFFQGRALHPKYASAMAVCLNGYPVEEGAWVRRPGTRELGAARFGKPGRVIPFTFYEAQPYTMEFTDGHLRLWNGTQIVWQLQNSITAITNASPAVFTTATAHGFSTGKELIFQPGANATTKNVLNRFFTIVVIDTMHFSLTDSVTTAQVTGSDITYAAGIQVAQVVDFSTVYTNSAWLNLRSVQDGEQAVLLCPQTPPYTLTVTAAPTSSYPFYTFALAEAVFVDGPYLPWVDNTTFSLSDLTDTPTVTFASIVGVNNGAGFGAADVGRAIRLLTEPPVWSSSTSYAGELSVSFPTQQGPAGLTGGVSTPYTVISGPSTAGVAPPQAPSTWGVYPQVRAWVWGTITAVNSTTSVNVAYAEPDSHPYYTGGSIFSLGLFSPAVTGSYPTCGTWHEGRLWLAGAVANRFDASMSNNPFQFSPSSAPTLTVTDVNAISYTLNSGDSNQMYWMKPAFNGVVVGTQAGEWLIQSTTLAQPLTPTSIQAHRVSKYGCANVLPAHTGIALIIVQKYRRKLLEFLSDVFTGRFVAPNLSQTAKDLAAPGVAEIAYQEEIAPIVWMRCDDGSLAGCTYRRISAFTTEEPNFVGWHQHALGDGFLVKSICDSPSQDGNLSSVTMVNEDPATGVYHVQMLTTLFDEDAAYQDAWFVDSGIVPVSATLTTGETGLQLFGLNAHNGKTVTAWVGVQDCGDFLVTNGSITVPFSDQFTLAYLQSLALATPGGFGQFAVTESTTGLVFPGLVGFTFTSRGQTLRPLLPVSTGAQNGPALGKTRRVHQIGALVHNAAGVSFGTRFTNTQPANFKSPSGVPYTNLQLVSGVFWTSVDDVYSYEGQPCWQITRPYPCTINSIEGFLETADR